MIDEHTEIEAKLPAEGISVQKFAEFMLRSGLKIERYEHVIGPDDYYESGAHVVRHRQDRRDGRHELTVKRRTSDSSTRDRLEIDLHFARRTAADDVEAFLLATGFKPAFTLVKDAHIYFAKLTPSLRATFVLYTVWQDGTTSPALTFRFIEVEAEKGSGVTPETAKRHVRAWVRLFQESLGAGEPLNESLYEIYSGKRYQSV